MYSVYRQTVQVNVYTQLFGINRNEVWQDLIPQTSTKKSKI